MLCNAIPNLVYITSSCVTQFCTQLLDAINKHCISKLLIRYILSGSFMRCVIHSNLFCTVDDTV